VPGGDAVARHRRRSGNRRKGRFVSLTCSCGGFPRCGGTSFVARRLQRQSKRAAFTPFVGPGLAVRMAGAGRNRKSRFGVRNGNKRTFVQGGLPTAGSDPQRSLLSAVRTVPCRGRSSLSFRGSYSAEVCQLLTRAGAATSAYRDWNCPITSPAVASSVGDVPRASARSTAASVFHKPPLQFRVQARLAHPLGLWICRWSCLPAPNASCSSPSGKSPRRSSRNLCGQQ
jgi:hypothetical protein